ncbi:hypothetical protein U3516DRAFT_771880 [Neocallimastix sp. 'constans']
MLKKIISIDQTVYFIPKKSNTNDRDIDSFSYNLYYEVDRNYHMNHEEITKSIDSSKFKEFKSRVYEVFNIALSNHRYLASQELTNINNDILNEREDMNNYLLVESIINKLKFVIQEIGNYDTNVVQDSLRLTFLFYDSREDTIPKIMIYFETWLFVFETVYYTCRFIVTQYEELIYIYIEIKNYLRFSENKYIISELVIPPINLLYKGLLFLFDEKYNPCNKMKY